MAKLTSDEYAKEGGPRCPVCLSHNVQGYDLELDNGRAFQNCLCRSCGAEWVDRYKLAGYSELEEAAEAV